MTIRNKQVFRLMHGLATPLALLGMGWPSALAQQSQQSVDFTRQIRPILSDNCFLCHGPDESSREAELRLDLRDSAIEDRGGYAAVVPGDGDASELVARITAHDASVRMPPAESQKQLSADEIALLRQWVAEGASYAKHWAFVPPVRPTLPNLASESEQSVRTPIDRFILARLEQESLEPADTADQVTLLRRLYLDLVGLPPTIAETEAFLSNDSATAYEDLVERLLASPHYGERWARHWLDAARYADSDGYEKDMQRTMWFWRDWVIEAFNQDKPYDQFVIEQIAGDMLPGAGREELIATGYLRNSMVNEEGGADPEQFRVEGIFDRMDAIGKGILGITTQCAQCHTHKYDPLTHAEYYGMFAFLNSCEEANTIAYVEEEQLQRDQLALAIDNLKDQLKRDLPDWKTRLRAWARRVQGNQPHWLVLKPDKVPYEGQKFRLRKDNAILSESFAPPTGTSEFEMQTSVKNITAIRLELLMDPQLPGGGPGRSLHGTGALSEFRVFAEPLDGSQPRTEIKLTHAYADVNPTEKALGPPFVKTESDKPDNRKTGPVSFAIDGNVETAWTTDTGPATRNQPRKSVFLPEQPFGFDQGTRLTIQMNQSHGGPNGNDKQNYLMGCYRFSVTEAPEPQADPLPARLRELVDQREIDTWTQEEWEFAFDYWRTTVDTWTEANDKIAELQEDWPAGHVQLVIGQRQERRATHRLERGDFLSPAESVEPSTPAFLHPFPDDQPRNRLGFARWLVHRDSPTAARTFVNRVWQEYFGIGLVETAEDLGSQSPPPSHPELLDWLAVEFMDSGWSVKHLHRLIVNSATYRQSSRMTDELQITDPRNRLLARGPRLRVDAEVVRDIALAASGLLNKQIGGRSVYPPAPRFLFQPPASYGDKNWFTEEDKQRYRRSIYVHAYRSVPYPPLQVFDAPKGDAACVRRVRSNTPLQALTLLNEPQFVACSRALARRVLEEVPTDDSARIRHAFRLCLTREPAVAEVNTLANLLNLSREHFSNHIDAAEQFVGSVGGGDSHVAVAESAAWTAVSRAILNLDETITKQ